MKYLSLFFIAISISFTACQQDKVEELSLAQKIAEDQTFEMMLTSTGDLLKHSLTNNWSGNAAELSTIINKITLGNAVSADYIRAEQILGMPYDAYLQKLKNYGELSQALTSAYPSLEKMSSEQRRSLFEEVYALNTDLPSKLTSAFGDNMRACPLQDICRGIVSIAVLIGGPILCDAIAGGLPIIGPLLCSFVLGIAEDLVLGICGGLPC